MGIVGYAYAIYQNGVPVAIGGSGYAIAPNDDFPEGVPMTVDTRMQIASCSKPITAIALLHLLQENNLSVETKAWQILKKKHKNPGKYVELITISDLLSHSTGYNFGYIESPYHINAQELLSKDIPNKPDGKYRYSNINTALARLVLEILPGLNYQEYVKQNILNPAGVGQMKLNISPEEAIYVYLYGENIDIGKPMVIDFSDEAAAYGWYSTINEMVQFLESVRTGKFLSKENTDKMFENGLGWGKKQTDYGDVYMHDGQWVIENNIGIRTSIGLFPDNVVAVLFINTNGPYFPGLLIRQGMETLYPSISVVKNPEENLAYVHFKIPSNSKEVRWTKDGSNPTINSDLFNAGIKVKTPVIVKVQGFSNKTKTGFSSYKSIN